VKNMEQGIYQAMTSSDTTSFALNNKTGNANYKLVEMENGECSIHSNNIIYVDGQMYAEVVTAREASSGMATGRVTAPRDIATGQASGKRMYKPISVINSDLDLNYNNIVRVDGLLYAEVITAREASSGMATGRNAFIYGDLDGDGLEDRVIIKTSASQNGQTLRGIVKTSASQNGQTLRGFYSLPEVNDELIIVQDGDDADHDYYVIRPRDIATGQASGKLSKQQVNNLVNAGKTVYILSPRDAASGQASGKRMQQSSQWSNDPYSEDALRYATDPYVEDVMRMYAVEGSSGQDMDFAVPLLLSADNTTWILNTNYPVQSVVRATKSRSNVQNNRTATKTRSNIQNNRMAGNSTDTLYGNQATVNTSRSNIKSQKMFTTSPDVPAANYATINTTRSNIKHNKMAGDIEVVQIERIRCYDGTCIMNAVVNIDGTDYDAVISGVLKTRHDTAKNSIGNIR
jgi:hypothetical protein